MKRITQKDDNGYYLTGDGIYSDSGVPEKFRGDDIDQVAAIEDILGDNYELDKLRELVEADKEGRCAVFSPGYPVVSTYHKDDDGRVIREVAGVVSEAEAEAEAALKVGEQDGHR